LRSTAIRRRISPAAPPERRSVVEDGCAADDGFAEPGFGAADRPDEPDCFGAEASFGGLDRCGAADRWGAEAAE
jgi:hypothetical protein